jgi:hypothetical protein
MIEVAHAAMKRLLSLGLPKKRFYGWYLVQTSDVGVSRENGRMVRFKGPWMALCGHRRGMGPTAVRVRFNETEFYIVPDLLKTLSRRVLDEKTLWDPEIGLTHTGLYLKNLQAR